jgi:outer membrane lipoprotein-sorting protein
MAIQFAGAGTQSQDAGAVIQRLNTRYAKIASAKMTVKFTVFGPKSISAVTTLQYSSPNKIWSKVVSSDLSIPTFTYVSDGKQVQAVGRPGYGTKAFALQTVQDDGPPVYKETLLLWDRERQLFERTKGFGYTAKKEAKDGKQWIVLVEDVPTHAEAYHYYIDPASGLIKRTLMYMNGKLVAEYVVQNQQINVPVDAKLFRIK